MPIPFPYDSFNDAQKEARRQVLGDGLTRYIVRRPSVVVHTGKAVILDYPPHTSEGVLLAKIEFA